MDTLIVDGAGCESCGALIRDVLEDEQLVVHSVVVDEAGDAATVVVEGAFDRDALNRVLAAASVGTGHTYSLRSAT